MTMRLDPNMISILGPVNPSDQAGSLPDQTTLTCKLWIADAFLMWVPYRVTHKLTLSSRDAELTEERGAERSARPHFTDEPKTSQVVTLDPAGMKKQDPPTE